MKPRTTRTTRSGGQKVVDESAPPETPKAKPTTSDDVKKESKDVK